MTDRKPKSGDYQVGYRKPPEVTKFKKGQSGNPSGRPRKKPDMSIHDAVNEALAAGILVTLDGKKTRLPAVKVIGKALVNKALSGDPKAVKVVLELPKSAPASAPLAGIAGGYERLAARLRLIQERANREDPRGNRSDSGPSTDS